MGEYERRCLRCGQVLAWYSEGNPMPVTIERCHLCDHQIEQATFELRALHEKVFLAALSGLCANPKISNSGAAIAEAHNTAIEAVRQHDAIIAERDAAIDEAIKGGA